ncbi:hypothetical protein LWI28_026582 [Acer negundo]|uniref:Uncharacterized protein n=1 Tax=Acer negundo TaxID=4023 RepID=A0AAD5ITP7_ACENE|nr:hypothetical protein LWI28_026582 [Acer negundo]
MSSLIKSKLLRFFLFVFLIYIAPTPTTDASRSPHVINFRSPNLYPEGLAWDPSAQHFVVGSLLHCSLHSVSDAGVAQTLISDPDLPVNATVLGLALDRTNKRILAVIQSAPPLPTFNALAAYDLRTRQRVFLALLDDSEGESAGKATTTTRPAANDVAVDFRGNAYVTNSAANFIWKVDKEGAASVFSRSPAFTAHPLAVERHARLSECGLNGIAYVSKGYLLVVQSNTGKMFKVNAEDGNARLVLLTEELVGADDIAIRKDGVVLVASIHTLWFLKSHDSWGEAVVYDKTALEEEKLATSVAVGDDDRAYVLYGHVIEGIMGNVGREEFSIVEVRSSKDSEDENIWLFVLIGLGVFLKMNGNLERWAVQVRRDSIRPKNERDTSYADNVKSNNQHDPYYKYMPSVWQIVWSMVCFMSKNVHVFLGHLWEANIYTNTSLHTHRIAVRSKEWLLPPQKFSDKFAVLGEDGTIILL